MTPLLSFSASLAHLLRLPAALLALTFFGCAPKTAKGTQNIASAVNDAQALVETAIASKVPGLSIAVAVDGVVVWQHNRGFANLASNTEVTSETRFRIGSISKPLTAAALALLVERGVLDVDAPLQTYIPDFPEKEHPITVRLLAGHLSGIRHYRANEGVKHQPFVDLRTGLKIFEADPLESAPGEVFKYSSYGWNAIGVAMERAAEMDFDTLMEVNVLRPLALSHTSAEIPDRPVPNQAECYEFNLGGSFVVASPVDLRSKLPAGGYLSTATDLVRFGSALLQPGFLRAESLRMLFTSQATAAGESTKYGMGWFVWPQVLYHSGDSMGATSILLLLPESRTVVALLVNRGSSTIDDVTGEFRFGRAPEAMLFNREEIAFKIATFFAKSAATPAH